MSNLRPPLFDDDTPSENLEHDRELWLSAHELSEFAFCSRAGLLCHDQRQQDTGQALDLIPRLDFLPDFDTAEIEATLELLGQQMERFMVGTIIGGFLLALIGVFIGWLPVAVVATVYLIPIRWFIQQCRICRQLEARLIAAQQAGADEPPQPLTGQVPIHWWSLLKSGMTPVRYVEPHRDRKLRLAGSPWRVLQRGSQRIPVFRKRSGEPELHEQQLIRLAAYCHLVEECELAEVPYGIVLIGDGYDGVAVPIPDDLRKYFHDCFEQAHSDLNLHHEFGRTPPAPAYSGACRNCPWGRPIRCRDQESSQDAAGFLTQGADGAMYRSPCGDLGRWTPPTELAATLKLC